MVDTTENATTTELRRMLKVCPACATNLSNHSYAIFAITVASDEAKDRLLEFFQSLKAHDWHRAIQFQEFDPILNAAEAYPLKCPSGSITLLIVKNPCELWESNSILDFEVLDSESGKELEALIESGKWQRL